MGEKFSDYKNGKDRRNKTCDHYIWEMAFGRKVWGCFFKTRGGEYRRRDEKWNKRT